MNRERFLEAAAGQQIDAARAEALYAELYGERDLLAPSAQAFGDRTSLSRSIQVLIWLGALGLIGAHAWWSTTGYEALGVGVVLALTLVWQVGFVAAAEWAKRQRHGTLEAVFAAVAVFYTPLTVYSLERLFGVHFRWNDFEDFYPLISGGWIFMELAAIAAAVAALVRYRRPFLMAPLILFTGFLAMDATTRALGGWDHRTAVEHVVLAVGIIAVLAGVVLDYRGWRRFAFWPHVGGVWMIAAGLELICDSHTLGLLIAAAVAFALAVWLARISYLVFGGLFTWVGLDLSAHGVAFPFMLTVGSLAFIGFAIWLARVDSPARRWLASRGLPAPQRDVAY